jgi:hypothetical protein
VFGGGWRRGVGRGPGGALRGVVARGARGLVAGGPGCAVAGRVVVFGCGCGVAVGLDAPPRVGPVRVVLGAPVAGLDVDERLGRAARRFTSAGEVSFGRLRVPAPAAACAAGGR